MTEKKEKPALKTLVFAGSVGLHLVLSTFVGFAMGYGLDKLFGTQPWLTFIFLLLGIVAGFRELFRLARKQNDGSR